MTPASRSAAPNWSARSCRKRSMPAQAGRIFLSLRNISIARNPPMEPAMINRFPGLTPTRSRAVVHDGLVFTVAVAPDPVTPSLYEQSVKALARIDESLALCGTNKSKILSAIVYITDMKQKGEMNRAWDEWVDNKNPPMRACIDVELEQPHIMGVL